MVFGAWCDRQYGFDYRGVRAHCGLAWFPTFNSADKIEWTANPRYQESVLEQRTARAYSELGLGSDSLYRQFIDNPDSVMFVPEPGREAHQWPGFTP
jgi:glucose-6-phosphate isomerase